MQRNIFMWINASYVNLSVTINWSPYLYVSPDKGDFVMQDSSFAYITYININVLYTYTNAELTAVSNANPWLLRNSPRCFFVNIFPRSRRWQCQCEVIFRGCGDISFIS